MDDETEPSAFEAQRMIHRAASLVAGPLAKTDVQTSESSFFSRKSFSFVTLTSSPIARQPARLALSEAMSFQVSGISKLRFRVGKRGDYLQKPEPLQALRCPLQVDCRGMRFDVLFFDLDGTLIHSG